jgi:hypothetical protein
MGESRKACSAASSLQPQIAGHPQRDSSRVRRVRTGRKIGTRETGDWRLEIGDWRLESGRLEAGASVKPLGAGLVGVDAHWRQDGVSDE